MDGSCALRIQPPALKSKQLTPQPPGDDELRWTRGVQPRECARISQERLAV